MQVNSVSNLSANSKASFGNMDYQRAMLQEFAKADDRALRQTAAQIAEQQVDSKKHKRISNAIFWSIPLFAGAAAAVAVTGGRIPMLKQFAKTATSWAASFAAIDLVFAGKRALNKNSEGAREFDRKHPVLSTILTIGASIGAMFAGGAAVNKLAGKLGPKIVAQAKKLKVDKFIKESKVINKLSEWAGKAPSSLKSLGKGLLDWSPLMLAFTSLAHTSSHERAKATQTVNNYAELKAAQGQVRTALAMADAIENEQ
ncbi:hypothetical protein IKL64_03100 [bacterium]|nr:hypothetical protein [bacterium]